jgi:hypothetical protein
MHENTYPADSDTHLALSQRSVMASSYVSPYGRVVSQLDMTLHSASGTNIGDRTNSTSH